MGHSSVRVRGMLEESYMSLRVIEYGVDGNEEGQMSSCMGEGEGVSEGEVHAREGCEGRWSEMHLS